MQVLLTQGNTDMGRGDKRTKRGKIFRSSTGKSRPKPRTVKKDKEKARRKKT